MKFSSYNLKKELVNVLEELGYVSATPIQEAVLPKALKGKSLICKSETGSGKTHAFLIPSINKLDLSLDKIQVLIVSPTVELAAQTYDFSKKICEKLNIGVRLLTSGITKQDNLTSLAYENEQPKIVIGTPGRVEDVLLKNKVDITGINTLILDECDMLLDEAYKSTILNLLDVIRPNQRLVFTATMKNHLISDTYKFVGAEEIIDINKKDKVNHNVSHHFVNLKHKDVVESLVNFLNITNPFYTLVFASQKTQVEKIYNALNYKGIRCAIINGDMESRERKITMRRIRNGEFNLIICSDIASRGIDLEDVSTVISIDLPSDLDYYYHRAGRTGRNNKKGDSYIFFNDDNMTLVNKLIEKNKNINFDYYVLRSDSLKKVETATGTKKKEKNEVLEAKIRKEVAKVKTKKVKPGYKKKVREAVKKAKAQHKQEIIKKNLREKRKENSLKGGYGN